MIAGTGAFLSWGIFVSFGHRIIFKNFRLPEENAFAKDMVNVSKTVYEATEETGDNTMTEEDVPQIYLISPTHFEIEEFSGKLSRVLDKVEIACMRMALESEDERKLSQSADALRELCHARDVPLVITHHMYLVERLGLDGVHFMDGARSIGKARKTLHEDSIIGAYCGGSRHDGMNAGELGADYISFGPINAQNLGHAQPVETELFQWWSEMIELPVVAEGGLTQDRVAALSPVTDFFAIGPEIWDQEDPLDWLLNLTEPLRR